MTRDQIVEEVKRLAKIEGTAPGRQKFEKATGISRSAWYGRYWTKWGDVLIEAGFQANSKMAPIPIENLFQTYLNFTEELGRVPTEGDLLLKARNDKSFPARTTFEKRLGRKNERLSKVIEYAQETGAARYLIEMLENAKIEEKVHANNAIEEFQTGYVYLMKSGKYYKIGKTNSVDRRRYEIGLQLPETIKPIHSIETDDPSGIEAYWHNRFRNKRKNGEWFDLSAKDIRAFRRRKNFM
jgi:Meiotically up-regulated gene 113